MDRGRRRRRDPDPELAGRPGRVRRATSTSTRSCSRAATTSRTCPARRTPRPNATPPSARCSTTPRDTGLPVLAVCRGMQMLVDFWGGAVTRVDGHVAQPHAIAGRAAMRAGRSARRTGQLLPRLGRRARRRAGAAADPRHRARRHAWRRSRTVDAAPGRDHVAPRAGARRRRRPRAARPRSSTGGADASRRARGGGGQPPASAHRRPTQVSGGAGRAGRCSRGSSTRWRAPASTTSRSSPATAPTPSPLGYATGAQPALRRHQHGREPHVRARRVRRRRRRADRVRRHRVRAAPRRRAGTPPAAGSASSSTAQWQRLWELRMEDPLADAETLRLDADGYLVELGRTPRAVADIEGAVRGPGRWCAPTSRRRRGATATTRSLPTATTRAATVTTCS